MRFAFHHADTTWLAIGAIAAGLFFNWGCGRSAAPLASSYDLSTQLLRVVPAAAKQVHSTNLSGRITLLDRIVAYRADECVGWHELPFELPRSDYLNVARAVFAGGLHHEKDPGQTVSALAGISFVATKLDLRELGQEFVPFLRSANSTVQYIALDAIGNLRPNGVTAHVAKLLSQPEWPTGRKTLETLVALKAKEAIPPLALRLKSTDRNERWAAIKSLEAVGDAAAAPYLADQLNDADVYNRYWTRQTLGRLNAVQELRVALQSPASNAEEAHALAWLAIADDKKALALVAQYLLEGGRIDSATMRETLSKGGPIDSTAMYDTLSKTNSHHVWRHLAAWLRQGRSPGAKQFDDGVLRETALFMSDFGSREAIPFLHELVKRPLPPERRYVAQTSGELARDRVVEALGKLHARAAVPDLMVLLDENVAGSVYSVRVAEIALSQIAEKTAVPELLKRVRDPGHPLRTQILMNLNAAVDEVLWQRIESASFQGLYVAPVDITCASMKKQTGLPIVLHFEPADNKSWPVVNTYVDRVAVRFGLERIVEALKRTGTDYTFILKDGSIHVVTVEDAIPHLETSLLRPGSLR